MKKKVKKDDRDAEIGRSLEKQMHRLGQFDRMNVGSEEKRWKHRPLGMSDVSWRSPGEWGRAPTCRNF